MQTEYRDVDLEESPCVFPPCGHFYTVESLDGWMDLASYFEKADDGKILGLGEDHALPFSADEVKKCSDCRGSLRSINRYGRLVRRAMIDESTRRFIVMANSQFVPLALEFENLKDGMGRLDPTEPTKLNARKIELKGGFDNIFNFIEKKFRKHYDAVIQLRRRIAYYLTKVKEDEQPFQQIVNLVENARRRQGVEAKFNTQDTLVQTRASLLAHILLMRCDLLMVMDVMKLRELPTVSPEVPMTAPVDFSEVRDACLELADKATATRNVLQAVEARLLFVQFVALERHFPSDKTDRDGLLEAGRAAIATVKDEIEASPGSTRPAHDELQGVERMLRGGTFYEPVSNEEMRAVVQAMAQELRGTGHWVSLGDLAMT